ncbi:MAG TPA: sugar phosphate nucleotidyltransferase [Chitinophagaceae bacterium]|jgi:dTDP-glucose pyrophosphorylase|nr:sugar phosphate nucleotidyltransferase [Chitinophagaceae bacterium]
MKPTLVILAAGMASRYGSMKQVEGFGPSGETIMDYSIYDAIRSGFGKVVFIIRKEFEKNFREIVGKDIEGRIEVDYVFQELNKYAEGFDIPKERTKPWGTAHAVLCADEKVKEPFAVINADDFYGKDGFVKAYNFLVNDCNEKTFSIIGYELLKTLSEHGTVNRGVCEVNSKGNLVSVVERLNVSKVGNKIVCNDEHLPKELPLDTHVSMNFWCFDPSVFDYTKRTFKEFLSQNASNPKAEFFIPIVADKYIKDGEGVIKVIPTSAKWFGVTYKEDAPMVRESLRKLVDAGEYPENLWAK